MRAVVQRVRDCSVSVDGQLKGRIETGLLVYLGVGRNDSQKDAASLCDKIVNLRIFTDAQGKMNLSVRDTGGSVLVISQFTLYGDAREGRRPSYTEAADPANARMLYEHSLTLIEASGVPVASGEFQTSMEVTYTNIGPVTILLDSEKKF
jgi:D-tyrosyl-tRNA(Tyr) deacylase